MKYRKKPVVVEAWPNEPWPPRARMAPEWLSTAMQDGTVTHAPHSGLAIKTLEGVMIANEGDWIIRGIKGELYPCKPDIFAATYEAVE